ncbi:MAG: tetratricopeptide repeat protein [bacterium]
MFFNLIPQLIIILALIGIIIVFVRKHPKAAEKEKQVFAFIKAQFIRLKTIIKKQIKERKQKFEIKKEKKSGVEAMIEEQKYIKIITQDPKNLFAYSKLGKLYFEQKNYDDAKAVFEQILKIEPKNKKAKDSLKKMPK